MGDLKRCRVFAKPSELIDQFTTIFGIIRIKNVVILAMIMYFYITVRICSRVVYLVYTNERAYARLLQGHCCASVKKHDGNIQQDFELLDD